MGKIVDWSKATFRASSWGNLLSEPQSKEDRLAGKLGKTCQKELLKVYNILKYGRTYDVYTKEMAKGKIAEPESILMVSKVEGIWYEKNEENLQNEWFTGTPDIFSGVYIKEAEDVSDIKTCWDLETFGDKIIDGVSNAYIAQLNIYYDLTGAKGGNIFFVLPDCPTQLLEAEKYKLLRSLDVATEDNPQYKEASQKLQMCLTYPDIPIEERVFKVPVPRNEELIQKMKDKVPRLRNWLAEHDEKRSKKHIFVG